MKSTIQTTLHVKDGMEADILAQWLESLPQDKAVTLSFELQAEQDDRFHYTPAAVTGIKATWEQEFGNG